MRVHIVGAGAIGGLVGARLARAGHQVTLVDANPEHVRAIQEHGLAVVGVSPDVVQVDAVEPAGLRDELTTVLLAVKSRHTRTAMEQIAPLLRPDGYVVSLQNGLEEHVIAECVGPDRTIGALVTFGGFYVEPGVVRSIGDSSLFLGELDGRMTQRIGAIAELLSDAHPVQVTDNIFGHLWTKTAIAAVYFATALADEDVPVLLADTGHRLLFGRLVREVGLVARAEGVSCEVVDGFDVNAFLDPDRSATTASWDNQVDYWVSHDQLRTGMWRDLAVHRRPTEIDHIIGPMLARASAAGIAVPALGALHQAVRDAEAGHLRLGPDALERLEASGGR